MTAYALIFVNFPAGATLDEVAVLCHSDMSTFYCHCLFLQPLSSKPHHHMININTIFFTINTMINSITMINTRFQPIWRRSPAWPQVDQWLSPPAFYSASQTPASSHRWKARPCQRRHFFIAHPSAGLISGHLSSGRSVEAASTSSIWHFQVPPGWKQKQLSSKPNYHPPYLKTNQPNNWPINQLFKICNHSLILIIMHQLQSFLLKCKKL